MDAKLKQKRTVFIEYYDQDDDAERIDNILLPYHLCLDEYWNKKHRYVIAKYNPVTDESLNELLYCYTDSLKDFVHYLMQRRGFFRLIGKEQALDDILSELEADAWTLS